MPHFLIVLHCRPYLTDQFWFWFLAVGCCVSARLKAIETKKLRRIAKKLKKLIGKEENIVRMFRRLARYGHAYKLPPEEFLRACRKLKVKFSDEDTEWFKQRMLQHVRLLYSLLNIQISTCH